MTDRSGPERRRIELLWIAPRGAPLPDLGPQLVLTRGALDSRAEERHQLVVLDSRACEGPEHLLQARRAHARPAILAVAEAELPALIPHLGEADELVLHTTPRPLVTWRVQQVLRRTTELRDGLTGLGVRRSFLDRLQGALAAATPEDPISALLVDIDNFKAINDRHGHADGDQVLQQLARLVLASCPMGAFPARYAGDRIAVLLAGDEAEVLSLGELIREAARLKTFGDGIKLTVSVGVATAAEPVDHRDLLRHVEEAVYAAKAAGRDRTLHYHELERQALRTDDDIDLFAFENVTRVIAERVANVITRRGRRLFREIKQQADVDALTGLYSRRYMDRRLAFEHQEATARDLPLTVALVDIDFFGQVNKRHGWPSGDRVLADLAAVIRSAVRGEDWVARYGGEEFCLVLSATPLSRARPVLERVRAAIEAHTFRTSDEGTLKITVSVGAAESRAGEDLAALLDRVSDHLLQAKRGGRNRVCS